MPRDSPGPREAHADSSSSPRSPHSSHHSHYTTYNTLGHAHAHARPHASAADSRSTTPTDTSTSQTPRRRSSTVTRHNGPPTPTVPSPLHAARSLVDLPGHAGHAPANSRSSRDSFFSILEDPFFQAYDPIASLDRNPVPPPQPAAGGHVTQAKQSWPPPRRESLTTGSSPLWLQQHVPANMETFNVAVIGAAGVGKSSFIEKVLGLPRPPISSSSSVRMVVDNITHMISLIELDLEHFELSPSQPIQWPKQINGHIMPRIDAALILYDVLNQETIRELPQTLAALTNSGLPAILVATKCEQPEDDWEVDADAMAEHKYFQACVASYKVSQEAPEVGRACLQAILRSAVAHRREENGETVSRRRAQSNLETPDPSGPRPLSQQSKHSRASSDFSLLKGFSSQPSSESYRHHHSAKSARTGFRLEKTDESFLDVDESDGESPGDNDDIPILQRNDDMPTEKVPKTVGVSFEELVDRLLGPRLSKADANYSDIFLCLYRKFAAPGELFSAILTRLDRVRDDKTAHYLSKTATQLRIIEVVARWVSLYPGDFARSGTRRALEDFIKHLSTEPIFSISAQHMRRTLQHSVTEDDDTGWANADDAADPTASGESSARDSGSLAAGISGLGLDEDGDDGPPGGLDNDRDGGMMSQSQYHQYDEYERLAALLEPTGHLPMSKDRYHIFMEVPDDDVAEELTRIEWILFSSIRIRDFVRHVSLSAAQKEKCKSLRSVNRIINHFNHTAHWVANMILLREKAKHRAQTLEKFMNIALKLRQMNNYNTLAAVLAGINGTAVHRLAQTRSLVPADVQKRFARLVILMGTQKSHFAYRLAWENSPLPRIPFIPLHRRDLVSAEEGSKTFVGQNGDRINWKKFEVLGEVLLPIMKSQGTPYPSLSRHDTIKGIILGCRMPTDDEEIYQRSLQVESGNSGSTEPSKKKAFPWFAK